jgi:hypothetical protein
VLAPPRPRSAAPAPAHTVELAPTPTPHVAELALAPAPVPHAAELAPTSRRSPRVRRPRAAESEGLAAGTLEQAAVAATEMEWRCSSERETEVLKCLG